MNITQFQEFVGGIIRTCAASDVPTTAIKVQIDLATVDAVRRVAGTGLNIELLPEGEKGFRYQGITFTW